MRRLQPPRKVGRIFVESDLTEGHQRITSMRDDLGGVEYVDFVGFGLLQGYTLCVLLREVAFVETSFLDCFEKDTACVIRIRPSDLYCFLSSEGFNLSLWLHVYLYVPELTVLLGGFVRIEAKNLRLLVRL